MVMFFGGYQLSAINSYHGAEIMSAKLLSDKIVVGSNTVLTKYVSAQILFGQNTCRLKYGSIKIFVG